MAELVHDDVISEMWRQEENFIVEIEVFERRATAPTATLVANGDAVPLEVVVLVEMGEARERQRARGFFVGKIVLGDTTGAAASPPRLSFPPSKHTL